MLLEVKNHCLLSSQLEKAKEEEAKSRCDMMTTALHKGRREAFETVLQVIRREMVECGECEYFKTISEYREHWFAKNETKKTSSEEELLSIWNEYEMLIKGHADGICMAHEEEVTMREYCSKGRKNPLG